MKKIKVGDLIKYTDYTVSPHKIIVGLYVQDVGTPTECWEDIYLQVGFEKVKVCSWQCEVING